MSANININDGVASFVSAVEPAWHNLGTVLPDKFTAEEAIKYTKLDFPVGKQPLWVEYSKDKNDPYRAKIINDSYAICRLDKRLSFGIVGSRYEIVHNTEAFNFFDTIIDRKEAFYETAGVLGMGETCFITAKLPDSIVLPGNDIINRYLLFTNSYDGSSPVTVLFTPTRVVCANTLAMALANGTHRVTIRHTKSAHDKLEEASKVMGLVKKSTDTLQYQLAIMAKKSIKDDQVQDFIEYVFLTEAERKALIEVKFDYDKTDISAKKRNVMNDVYTYYHNGLGQDNIRGTVFGAYSAVNGYFSNVKKYKSPDTKMESLILGGNDYAYNAKAFTQALILIEN